MRMILRLALVAALTLVASVGVVTTAEPAKASCVKCPPIHTGPRKAHPKDNPLTKHEWSLLTKKQRKAMVKSWHHKSSFKKVPPGVFAAQLRAQGVEPDSVIYCGEYALEVYAENGVGWHIWYFKNTVHWCWNGSRVLAIDPPHTQVKIYSWASLDGWEYNGIQDSAQFDYYHDKWVYSTYRQGKFSFCPPRIFCVSTKYPWMYQYTYGSGGTGIGGWGA